MFAAVPAVLIFVCVKISALKKLGVVLLCYLLGMIIGNVGLLPHSFITPSNTTVTVTSEDNLPHTVNIFRSDSKGNEVFDTVTLDSTNNYAVSLKAPYESPDKETYSYTSDDNNVTILSNPGDSSLSLLQSITICFGLPLVLFSLDIKNFFKIAKKGLLCMLLACISIIVVTFILHLIFRSADPDSAKYAAGAVAVYTGGTVNFAAIRTAIGISNDSFIVFNTYDSVVSVIYIFFLSTVGTKFFTKILRLRPFEENDRTTGTIDSSAMDESVYAYKEILKKENILGLLAALGISAAIFGVSYALNMLVSSFNPSLGMTVMMLSITTLSIALSFIRRIREIRRTFQLGMYIIYIFCFSVACSADFRALLNFSLPIFCYVFVSILASLLLHSLLSRLFKIDAHTMIITSVSAICSPPFVPAMAAALNNSAILISGLVTGVVGYAVGNYLGNAVYYLYSLI